MTYRIPDRNLFRLTETLGALNKRARRLGLAEIQITEAGHEDRPLYREDTLAAAPEPPRTVEARDAEHEEQLRRCGYQPIGVRRYHYLEIVGEDPVLNGWRFIATLQHLPPGENTNGGLVVTRTVPGEEVPAAYRQADPLNCDHCHTRRERRDTYLLRHEETGQHKQVGSTCLGDFLGHADPHKLAEYAQLLAAAGEAARGAMGEGDEDEDPERPRGGREHYLVLETFLGYAATAVREWGWRSRTDAEWRNVTPTSELTLGLMFPPAAAYRTEPLPETTEADRTLAREAHAWAQELIATHPDDLDEYRANIRALAASGIMEARNAGLAASIVPTYIRENAKRLEKDALQASQHRGAVGERLEFTGQVTMTLPREGTYGVTTLVKFNAGGDALIWWASGEPDLETGHTYRAKGTVKKHDERNGIAQTTLTRVKVLEEIEEAGPDQGPAPTASEAAL